MQTWCTDCVCDVAHCWHGSPFHLRGLQRHKIIQNGDVDDENEEIHSPLATIIKFSIFSLQTLYVFEVK